MSGEWPKLICLACGTIVEPHDEGVCDCNFIPDQEPRHVAVIPAERLDEVESNDAIDAASAAITDLTRNAEGLTALSHKNLARTAVRAAIQAAKGSEGS